MKHLFLNKELSQLAKQKGFDEECLTYYFSDGTFADAVEEDSVAYPGDPLFNKYKNSKMNNGEIAAPLYQQIIDWLENKQLFIIPELNISDGTFKWYGQIWLIIDYNLKLSYTSNPLKSKYLALDEAIEEAFKLI